MTQTERRPFCCPVGPIPTCDELMRCPLLVRPSISIPSPSLPPLRPLRRHVAYVLLAGSATPSPPTSVATTSRSRSSLDSVWFPFLGIVGLTRVVHPSPPSIRIVVILATGITESTQCRRSSLKVRLPDSTRTWRLHYLPLNHQ